MRHLKRFNEELKLSTYKRASEKLKKIGHSNRAKAFDDVIEKKKKEEEDKRAKEGIENWKNNVAEYSKFGEFKFKISPKGQNRREGTNPQTGHKFWVNQKGKSLISDNFYLYLDFDSDAFDDEIYQNKSSGSFDDSFDINFSMSVGIIPKTEDLIKECKEKLTENKLDPDFGNGFFWSNWIGFRIKADGDNIKISDFYVDPYDESVTGYIDIADRRTAGLFRNLLIGIFSNKIKYPSGRKDIPDMYEYLESNLCNRSGLSSEYGLEMNHFVEALKRTSANSLFTES